MTCLICIILKHLSARDLNNTASVSQPMARLVRDVKRKPILETLPSGLLLNVFKFLSVDDLLQLSKCRNATIRCAAFNSSLWKRVVILEPYVDPYGDELRSFIRQKTGKNPLLAHFDTDMLSETLQRFERFKIYPSL